MMNTRGRLVALVVGTAGLLATSASVAAAATAPQQVGYGTLIVGPYSSQVGCNEVSASFNDPPDSYTSACFPSATDPRTGVSRPGWYFRDLVSLH
jgi:hypothetical protein